MKRIYVDVDTQFDFMNPQGALYVPGAEGLLPNVQKLVEAASLGGKGLLVGSVDTHDFRSSEFIQNGGPFPPHCVKGTLGWCKMAGTLPERSVILPRLPREHGLFDPLLAAGCQAFYFEKDRYSIFDNAGIDGLTDAWFIQNKILETPAVEVFVFGVATDYCVFEAAMGFKKLGFRTFIVGDAIAAVTEDGNAKALDSMFRAGIDTVFTSEIV